MFGTTEFDDNVDGELQNLEVQNLTIMMMGRVMVTAQLMKAMANKLRLWPLSVASVKHHCSVLS